MADPYANPPPADHAPEYGGAPPGGTPASGMPPGGVPAGAPAGAPTSTPPPYNGEQPQPYSAATPDDGYGQKRPREDDMHAALYKRPANGAMDGPQTVYRLLCDQNIMGGMIGRGGETITAIQDRTGASIQAIQDAPPHCVERVIIVSGSRNIPPGEQYNAAQRALFELFDQQLTLDRNSGGPVLRMLICSTQAGSVIGKQGATIKEMKETSGCSNIKVLQPADLPPCGLASDKLFHVTGGVDTLRRVLDMASVRLRDTPPKELPSHDPCQNAFPPGGPGGGPPGGPMMGPGGPMGGFPMGPPMGGPGYGPPRY